MAPARPTFGTTKLREGYDVDEVDALVNRIFDDRVGVATTMTADEVRDVRFTPTRLRKGYDMGEVDGWLDEVVVELGGQPSPAAPGLASYAAATQPAPTQPAVSQAAGDRLQAALIIAIVVAAAVWIYVSRF